MWKCSTWITNVNRFYDRNFISSVNLFKDKLLIQYTISSNLFIKQCKALPTLRIAFFDLYSAKVLDHQAHTSFPIDLPKICRLFGWSWLNRYFTHFYQTCHFEGILFSTIVWGWVAFVVKTSLEWRVRMFTVHLNQSFIFLIHILSDIFTFCILCIL